MSEDPPPAVGTALLHGLCAPADRRLDAFLRSGDHLLGGLRPVVAAVPGITVEVEADAAALARAGVGLGDGPAVAEAVAVRLRRAGMTLSSGRPVRRVTRRQLVDLSRARGRDAVRVLGSRPVAAARGAGRLLVGRRLAVPLAARGRCCRCRRPRPRSPTGWRSTSPSGGGCARARRPPCGGGSPRSSYVVLCYHRLAGTFESGQERMDVAPGRVRAPAARAAPAGVAAAVARASCSLPRATRTRCCRGGGSSSPPTTASPRRCETLAAHGASTPRSSSSPAAVGGYGGLARRCAGGRLGGARTAAGRRRPRGQPRATARPAGRGCADAGIDDELDGVAGRPARGRRGRRAAARLSARQARPGCGRVPGARATRSRTRPGRAATAPAPTGGACAGWSRRCGTARRPSPGRC